MSRPDAPPEGYVTTRDAALMWGCHPKNLSTWMQEAGIAPVKAAHPQHPQIVTYWWDPREVLQVRAILKKRPQTGRRVDMTQKEKRALTAQDEGHKLLALKSRMEYLRRYYLDKGRKRRGEL
ncbi:MAG: hypothetical protein ACO3GP_08345 [Candidatus Limnocylindrus sp.]